MITAVERETLLPNLLGPQPLIQLTNITLSSYGSPTHSLHLANLNNSVPAFSLDESIAFHLRYIKVGRDTDDHPWAPESADIDDPTCFTGHLLIEIGIEGHAPGSQHSINQCTAKGCLGGKVAQ